MSGKLTFQFLANSYTKNSTKRYRPPRRSATNSITISEMGWREHSSLQPLLRPTTSDDGRTVISGSSFFLTFTLFLLGQTLLGTRIAHQIRWLGTKHTLGGGWWRRFDRQLHQGSIRRARGCSAQPNVKKTIVIS